MDAFWLCFVPMFVAVDAIGTLPIYLSLIEGLDERRIRMIVLQSVITASIVAVVFILIGKAVLNMLGVTVADFMIAGGILLFLISIAEILVGEQRSRIVDPESLGAVPIGVPLIVGPAVLTMALLLTNQYGILPVTISALINILIAGGLFFGAKSINKLLGKAGAKTVSKLASLLLAAIGVMIVRKGIFAMLGK